MNQPRIGEYSHEHRAVCLYAPDPDSPPCDRPAVIHIQAETPTHGTVGLPTCGVHVSIARAAGRWVAEHPFEGWCGFPATIWHTAENRCVLDDSGERRVQVRQLGVEIAVKHRGLLDKLAGGPQ